MGKCGAEIDEDCEAVPKRRAFPERYLRVGRDDGGRARAAAVLRAAAEAPRVPEDGIRRRVLRHVDVPEALVPQELAPARDAAEELRRAVWEASCFGLFNHQNPHATQFAFCTNSLRSRRAADHDSRLAEK